MTAAGKKDEMQSTEQGKELTSPEHQPCPFPLDHTFAATPQLSLPLSPSLSQNVGQDQGEDPSPHREVLLGCGQGYHADSTPLAPFLQLSATCSMTSFTTKTYRDSFI